MTTSLYNDALNAAEELKYAAEEKAKKQIIEAMSPQIKLMVEQNIMSEMMSDEYDMESSEEYNVEGEDECGMEGEEECGMEGEEESDKKGNPATYDDQKSGEKNLHGTRLESYELSSEASSVLAKLVSVSAKKDAIRQKLSEISKGIKALKKATIIAENKKGNSQIKKRINVLYKNLVIETKNIASYDIFKKDRELLKEFYNVIKELNNMSRRRSNKSRYINENIENLLEMNLFEEDEDMPEDESEEDPFADMSDEDEDMPEEEDEDMPEDESSDMSVDGSTTVEELARMAGLLDEEEEEPAEESEMEEGLWELDEYETESEAMEGEANLSSGRADESYRRNRDVYLEIDENMLRKEIGRMKRLREGEAKDMASHFGGGSIEGEMFVDGVELNKLHEMKIKAAKVVRMNRMLESKLSQYKKALRGMKTQLTEMNLFNAKLLYANKLMQNRDLTIKQQRNIVESLDEAKTLGEAKILFESLSKSLVRPTNSRSGNLSEGAIRRPMSSSSRPVSSGQSKPMNESVALDRWATLAGIKK